VEHKTYGTIKNKGKGVLTLLELAVLCKSRKRFRTEAFLPRGERNELKLVPCLSV
jgi:hypothetical protein